MTSAEAAERIAQLEARRSHLERELDEVDELLWSAYYDERQLDESRDEVLREAERARNESRLAEVRAGRW